MEGNSERGREVRELRNRVTADLESCAASSKEAVTNLAKTILGKDPTKDELVTIITIELGTTIRRISVHGGEKRQNSLAYSSSDVGGSLLSETEFSIIDLIDSGDNIIDAFVSYSSIMKKFLSSKFERMEDFLRRMLMTALSKDSLPIPEESRFGNNARRTE